MSQLKGKVIVVTGGGRGIGQAIAQGCAKAGAQVFVAARTQSDLDQCKKTFACETVKADVTRESDLENLFKLAFRQGQIFSVICAAGVYGDIGPFAESSFEKWRQGLEINLIGTARTIHIALPSMASGGRIILFSGGGQAAMPNFSSYVTSKGAIWRFTETLAAELAPKNISVNAIAPGAVNTQFLDELLKAGPQKVGEEMYKKSLEQKKSGGQSLQKAVDLVLFLLSEKAKAISGRTLSAMWDDWSKFAPEDFKNNDLFTYRRVIDVNGGTKN